MSAQKSIGTTLTKTTGTPQVIADLTNIGEIGLESNEIDVTTLDSEDSFKEFIAGFKDAGEVSIAGIIKSEANMEDMFDLANAQSVESWEVEFLSGAIWFLRAFVKAFKEGETTVEGVRTFTGVLRITGKPVYAPTGVSA